MIAALAVTGPPPPPAVQVLAHHTTTVTASPSGASGPAGAFTPILDPNEVGEPDNGDDSDEPEHPDESENPAESEVMTGRDRGWGAAQRRTRAAGPKRAPELDDTQLARVIEDVTDADGYVYSARDSAGHGMDTAKVIDRPGGGYLAVYHWAYKVKLATSTDLKTWRFRADLEPRATQPTIVATSDGGFLVAVETETSNNGQVKLLHYRNLAALQAGRAARTFTAPRTLSRCNEGTPNITAVRLSPDLDHSVIELGLHYHRNCDTDREATARLTNFRHWEAAPAPGTDGVLTRAAATVGKKIRGNIGDRDTLAYGGRRFSLNEVQYVKGRFGTWRTYLSDATTGRARPLNIRTHRGSRAFANPTISRVTAPEGRPAIVVGLYLPAEGAALGEGGQLIYYRTLHRSPGDPPTLPPPATHSDFER